MNAIRKTSPGATENSEHFRTIRTAIDNDRLVVFIGSGISCDSGLPSWGELINAIKGSVTEERATNYLKIAEKYYHQYGQNTYYARISELFPENAEPNELHRLLLQLGPRHIVTTNWDNLIEKEILKQGCLYFTVVTDDQLASSPSSQLLIKMHGDLRNRNIVFKESDYSGYKDSRPLIENYIKSLFTTNVVLFLGYSLSDYNLDQILSWTRNRTKDSPPCYAIFTDQIHDYGELCYLANKGVYPISPYTSSHFPQEGNLGLSPKGYIVASVLSTILNENFKSRDDLIREINEWVSEWNSLHPSIFIRLVKQKLRITEINKIYYDSEHNAVCYRLDKDDLATSRDEYREMRRLLKQILQHLPVSEAWLLVTADKGIRLDNSYSKGIVCDAGRYDFVTLSSFSKPFRIAQLADPERCYELAFSMYAQYQLVESNELFGQAANLYLQQKRYARTLLSAFSRRQSIAGSQIVFDSSFERTLELRLREELPQFDSVSKETQRFPRHVSTSLLPLTQYLSSNNTYCLEQLLIAQRLNNELKSEIKTIKKDGIVFSSKHHSVQSLLQWNIDFVLRNRISILYTSEFRLVLKTHFDSVLSLSQVDKCPELDIYLCYAAIASYDTKEIADSLFEILGDSKQLAIAEDALEYTLLVLGNSLSSLNMYFREEGIRRVALTAFGNAITLLGYCAISTSASDRVMDILNNAIQSPAWLQLADTANRYLATRESIAPGTISIDKLDCLLAEQIRRLSDIRTYTPLENKHMLPNILGMLSRTVPIDARLQQSERNIDKLIHTITVLPEAERLNAITDILFPLFWFASGTVRLKIENYLREYYSELQEKGLAPEQIVFALNLYSLDILSRADLDSILQQLARIVDNSRLTGRYSSSLLLIQKQLETIPEDAKDDHIEALSCLAEATARMRLFGF